MLSDPSVRNVDIHVAAAQVELSNPHEGDPKRVATRCIAPRSSLGSPR